MKRELPDVRDGLTRVERVVLVELAKLQAERGERGVSLVQLYGRVVEHVPSDVDLSQAALQAIVRRLAGK